MKKNTNYLEKIPTRSEKIKWSSDELGIVTLEIENKGLFNRIAQKLFKKPRVSYVHLDENGSFAWTLIDGSSDVYAIGQKVEEHFGEKSHPLYERLVKFFQILESYDFINWKQ
jgi:hypothetical protein